MRPTSVPATIVEVQANEHGHMDEERTAYVFDRLFDLADHEHTNDVLIDVSHVRSLTNRFLNVLISFSNHIRHQDRRVALCGIHFHCAGLLRDSDIEEIIDCRVIQREVLCF